MTSIETPKQPAADAHDLANSFLFRMVRGASELVRADGGTISATNLLSGETFDFTYGSGYRPPTESGDVRSALGHTRVALTEIPKVWSPNLPFRTEKLNGALWLYRRDSSDASVEFTEEDKRLVRVLLDSAAFGLEQALEVARLRELLHWAGINTVKAMIHAIRAKDPYTSQHCQRVADYSGRIAESMGYYNVEEIWAAASVHDVGKIGLMDAILTKSGRLERGEMEAVREHSHWGGEIVQQFTDAWDLGPGVRHHHEWLDGRGYPDGLKGEEIPLSGRIITVADAFDAMTSDRPYRGALDTLTALNRLSASAGIQFDPRIVAIARDCLN
ncbi:MAG: HD-GYP domain-containing protein [Armatimonadetes bacterium]|nr:HD-GYP domain-containing protein [Armatimonadota bacterium]